MLPRIAQGDSNKVWIIPSEIGKALEGVGSIVGQLGEQMPAGEPPAEGTPSSTARRKKVAVEAEKRTDEALQSAESEVAAAIAAAEEAAKGGIGRLGRGTPNDASGAGSATGSTSADATEAESPGSDANGSSEPGTEQPGAGESGKA